METVTDVVIDENFVMHVLDNRLPTVQCSQALTPVPEALRNTLHKYLLSLLRPQFRRKRYGRFRPESAVLAAYQQMVAGWQQTQRLVPDDVLAGSQRIASALFEVMRHTPPNGARSRPGDITPGDLLVGLFHAVEPEPSPVPWLFLIKVDLESAWQRQIQPYGPGGMHTVLTSCEGLIPKFTAEKVHKFALIRCANTPTEYDVLMSDPQGGKFEVAKFFAEDFLQTEAFRTPEEQAELLVTRTYDWVANHEETLSPQEKTDVMQSVRELFAERAATATPIAPRDLVATLPLYEPRSEPVVAELRQSFEEAITAPENGVDTIPSDRNLLLRVAPRTVQNLRVTYQLDHGVQLIGEQEAIERLFAQPPRRVQGQTELTIRTTTFRPVL